MSVKPKASREAVQCLLRHLWRSFLLNLVTVVLTYYVYRVYPVSKSIALQKKQTQNGTKQENIEYGSTRAGQPTSICAYYVSTVTQIGYLLRPCPLPSAPLWLLVIKVL